MSDLNAPPIQETGELFRHVQTSGIFDDSKTFVDSVPKDDPKAILAEYYSHVNDRGFDLAKFIAGNFHVPKTASFHEQLPGRMERFIDSAWDPLTISMSASGANSTLLSLPYSQVVPGSRFREPYYWDSAFMFECLLSFEKHEAKAMAMLYNMEAVLEEWGHIPNGFRTYYTTRSQPPMLARMSRALRRQDKRWIGRTYKGKQLFLFPELAYDTGVRVVEPELVQPEDDNVFIRLLETEYSYWMKGEHDCEENAPARRVVKFGSGVVNRYYDDSNEPRPESYREDLETAEGLSANQARELFRDIRAACESGWDFSSRWFQDQSRLKSIRTTKIIPIDLNALLFSLEKELSILHFEQGDFGASARYEAKAMRRREAVNKLCWNEERGFYYDFDWEKGEQTPVESIAAVFPLMCEMADSHQAERIRRKLEADFLKEGGLVATLTEDTGQQWDYPNAWAPLQFAAVQGLLAYAKTDSYSDPYFKLAFQIAARFHKSAREFFEHTGLMMEKYNAVETDELGVGGEYKPQTGFGWTNAVVMYFQRFLEQYTFEDPGADGTRFDEDVPF